MRSAPRGKIPPLPLNPRYEQAFAAIDRDPNQLLAVVDRRGVVTGCMQLTFLPGLSRLGAWRGQIEGVRVAASERGSGVGAKMMAWRSSAALSGAAGSCSSRRTSPAPTPTASTSAWASAPRTRG